MSDDILHASYVRMRVTGTGNLDVRLLALYDDDPDTELPPTVSLVPLTMETATPRFAQFHANFEQQYMQVEVTTDVIDEFFRITKITLYVKPVAVAYPM